MSDDFVCDDCGVSIDTPQHVHGCRTGRAVERKVDRAVREVEGSMSGGPDPAEQATERAVDKSVAIQLVARELRLEFEGLFDGATARHIVGEAVRRLERLGFAVVPRSSLPPEPLRGAKGESPEEYVARLRRETPEDSQYLAVLERHLAESCRVNLGLIAENRAAKDAERGSQTNREPERRCKGAGEIEVGTSRDEFGNWDTETHPCAGCPDCLAALPVRDETEADRG